MSTNFFVLLFFVAHVFYSFLVSGTLEDSIQSSPVQITDGNEIDIKKVPHQASIKVGGLICGGAIISDKYVLTSGYCGWAIRVALLFSVKVRAGSNRTDTGVTRKVKNVFIHPKFTGCPLDYSIGIIELKTPFPRSDSIKPVKLADRNPRYGAEGRVAGWGVYNMKSFAVSKTLRYAKLKRLNLDACTFFYGKLNDRMLCFGAGWKNACWGDNGGAITVKKQLVGLVSDFSYCGIAGIPGVFVNVVNEEIRDFIRNITNI